MSAPAIERLNAALSGRYHIESELGEGGMATVYLAADIKHGRKVALKVLKPELAAVVGADRFLAEIKTTANLQHPHILPLFDSGEADSFLFYAMPYVEGETLRDEVYVVPFPDVGASRSRVSISGGSKPRWADSGRELFYRSGDDAIVSVDVTTNPTFDHGEQRVLFPATPYRSVGGHRMYEVTPGGDFIMVREINSGLTSDLVVVDGFGEVLERLVPN